MMRPFISNYLVCLATVCFSGIFLNCTNSTSTGPGAPATELEGTWKGHTLTDTATSTIIFTGNSFSFTSTLASYAGTFSINAALDPKQLDALITQCPFNPQYVGKTCLCIYKISNDTLTYAGNAPGNTRRPTSFLFDPTGTTAVFIFNKQ